MLEGCERDRQKQKKPQTVFAGVVIGQGHADAKDQIFSRNFGYKNFWRRESLPPDMYGKSR